MKFIKEEKAQSGAVFRLMIDGIIGLAIFMVILSSLSYFQNLRLGTSQQELFAIIESAKNSPNGVVFPSKDNLLFAKGDGISTNNLQDIIGLNKECFTFESGLGFAKVIGGGVGIEFTGGIETKIYAKCSPSGEFCDYGEEECCQINCIISFGKKLDSDIQ
ncbi:MAG: hypothetical protein WC915_02170 [archaeon]